MFYQVAKLPKTLRGFAFPKFNLIQQHVETSAKFHET